MRSRSVIAAALVAGLAVAGSVAAKPVEQHRKLSQGIDEGLLLNEILGAAIENLADSANFGIDAGDFTEGLAQPLLTPFTGAAGGGVERILQPVYAVFQNVPGFGDVCA